MHIMRHLFDLEIDLILNFWLGTANQVVLELGFVVGMTV